MAWVIPTARAPRCVRNLLQVKRSFPEILNLLRKTEAVKPSEFIARDGKARELNPQAHTDKPPVPRTESADKKEDKKNKDVVFVRPVKEIVDILHQSTGYKLSERRAGLLAPFLAKKGSTLYDGMNSETAALGQMLANHLGIGFTSTAHTSDFVPILAIGPGSEAFRGFVQNTDVFYRYLAFGKIDYRNPREPEIAESRPAAANGGRSGAVCAA